MKGDKTIHCEKCCGEITDIDDLVVTNNFLSISPYHEECFSKDDVCQEGCRIKFYIRYSYNVFQNFQSI
jgi:hypothetical protein